MADNSRFMPAIPGLDGAAAVTATQTKYFVAPRALNLMEIYSLANGAVTFTNETGQLIIDYSTTIGGAYTTVYTETAANANTWVNGTPKAHVLTAAQQVVRIPAGAVVRVRFIVAGAAPSFAGFGVHPAFRSF